MKKSLIAFILLCVLQACSISYKFNGASINYDVVKTLHINQFINQAPLVYGPLENRLNESLKDYFTRNTRLQLVNQNGDMELEGEIVAYEFTPMAVQEDAYASQTKLTITVRMRFKNHKEEGQDKEETFSANQPFNSDIPLDQVQDALITQITDEIVEQIFNSTMARW